MQTGMAASNRVNQGAKEQKIIACGVPVGLHYELWNEVNANMSAFSTARGGHFWSCSVCNGAG